MIKNIFRRKFLINPDFQLPFVVRMIIINLLTIGILYVGMYIIFYRFNFLGSELGFESTHKFYDFIEEQFILVTTVFVAIAISSSFLLGVYSFFLSHRIAGPLENIKIRFKRLETEKPKDCKTQFRKDDFFHDLASAYNEHIEKTEDKKQDNEEPNS
tara:strand:+ start:173551 stop:174021 length:471 start_codon:yes stop_codon:yes gene_type:complete